MAEILLSLTIIGVVAAITLPSLTGNINERTWNTQRKALYARFSQAIALMPALNGYGTLTEGNDSTSAVDTAAETFVTEGLSKVLKINNICDSEHLADCGIASTITPFDNGSQFSMPLTLVGLNSIFNGTVDTTGYEDNMGGTASYKQIDTKAAAFETQNGESIVVYYNPYCIVELDENSASFVQPKVCANFVYDLNGNKGPNTVGKDIGIMTAFYPTDSVVVAPVPIRQSGAVKSYRDAIGYCKTQDSESRLPNKDELGSMFVNRKLFGAYSYAYQSSSLSTVKDSDGVFKAFIQYFETGRRYPYYQGGRTYVWCVKR